MLDRTKGPREPWEMDAIYTVQETQLGTWGVYKWEGSRSTATLGPFDTESDAWRAAKNASGLTEPEMAAVTRARHYLGQCYSCGQLSLRISRRSTGLYRHCSQCGFDELIPGK